MVEKLKLYLDDSGTRHPDKGMKKGAHGRIDHFALGGVVIRDEDEEHIRRAHGEFCDRWKIDRPLHSYEIRHRVENFRWLDALQESERYEFYDSLGAFLCSLPAIGFACVIDRPGYNHRYRKKYGRYRWSLCRTAFAIVVERAAKYAKSQQRVLSVLPERCNSKDDKKLEEYFWELRTSGIGFATETSNAYNPLTPGEFDSVLYDFKLKSKTSPLAQIADLYLWPLVMGQYDSTYRPFKELTANGRVIDCLCETSHQCREIGIKASCFDLVTRK